MRQTLPLRTIVRDPAVQVREKLDPATIEQYADDWELLPPVTVFLLPDGRFLLTDGFHRLKAAEQLGLEEIEADVREGDYAAAQDEAARANMAGMRALKKEERHRAIMHAHQRHPGASNRELATLLGVSRQTVDKVVVIEEVRADIDEVAINSQLPAPSGRVGRRKKAIKDDHLVALSEAPKEERAALAQATASRGWAPKQTRAAAKEIKDPSTPEERKDALRRGAADPLMRGADGAVAATPETFARAMAEPTPSDAYLTYKVAAEHLAKLVPIPATDVIDGLRAEDLRALSEDVQRIPRYIGVLEAIREAARRALRPILEEVR